VVTDASMLAAGDQIQARVARGTVQATVTGVTTAPDADPSATRKKATRKRVKN
jgi:hypothetical protein